MIYGTSFLKSFSYLSLYISAWLLENQRLANICYVMTEKYSSHVLHALNFFPGFAVFVQNYRGLPIKRLTGHTQASCYYLLLATCFTFLWWFSSFFRLKAPLQHFSELSSNPLKKPTYIMNINLNTTIPLLIGNSYVINIKPWGYKG